jgi:uncharacterized protein
MTPLITVKSICIGWLGLLIFTLAPPNAPTLVAAEPVAAATKPLKAMLVTGGCCHDYDAQKVIITEGLTQQLGPIEWTIHQYAEPKDTRAEVYDNPAWAEGFDLVVHNECFGAMNDAELVNRIIAGHRKYKVPAVFIHCSMHSYRTSAAAEAWREFIGVTSTFHEGVKRPLTVVPTQVGKNSGLVKPLGDHWQTPNGELYIIVKIWPETKVLATAYSIEQKADQPVIWQREEPGVRVFATSLGHHNETMRSEQWQKIVADGTRWALSHE